MTRRAASVRGRGHHWREIRRLALEVHVRVYGWTCPGWGVPGHWSADLTGDHSLPVSAGGLSTLANCQILCRACNSRKGSTVPRPMQLSLELALETRGPR